MRAPSSTADKPIFKTVFIFAGALTLGWDAGLVKVVRAALLLFTLVLVFFVDSAPVRVAAVVSPAFSSVWVDPVNPHALGSQVSMSVRLNLTASDSFSFFDVKLNYTTVGSDGRFNYTSAAYDKVVLASPKNGTVDTSTGVFNGGFIGWECIDGHLVAGNVCPAGDAPPGSAPLGQVHFEQFNPGSDLINGPLTNVTLFNIRFNVTGSGTVVFKIASVRIVDPTGPNLSTPVVRDIPVVTRDAVFSNSGVVAFFNFRPSYPPPPTILPNQNTVFDARGSFNATQPSSQITSYTWNFGDGSSETHSVPSASHRFGSPQTYNVQLNVTDQSRHNGTIIMPVIVQPALGGLDIQVNNQRGSPLRGNVAVQLFNSTILSAPFLNRTVNQAGEVGFQSLKPDAYLLKFSGPTISNYSRTENVAAGWTRQDTVYVFESFPLPPRPPANYDGLVFVGTMVGALGIFAGAILLRRRRSERKAHRANRPLIPKTVRSGKKLPR